MEQLTSPAPRRKPSWRRTGARVLISLAMLALLFRVLDFDAIRAGFAALDGASWAMGLLAFLGLHLISAIKWRFFLVLAGAPIGFLAAIRCYSAALFANLCLPSLIGGDVLRVGLALSVCRRKEAVVLGSVVDRTSDLLALAALVLTGALLAPGAAKRIDTGAINAPLVLVIALGGGGLTAAAAGWLLARRPLRSWPRKVARRLLGVRRALRAMRARPLAGVLGLLLCYALQGGFVFANVALGRAMGLELDYRLWLLLWPLAKIAAMLPLSLGGIGVREAAFAVLVTPFADPARAVSQSLVWQSILIAGGLIAGIGFVGLRSGARLRSVEASPS